jgi:4-hydroxybenzoate polyprenyltransferase
VIIFLIPVFYFFNKKYFIALLKDLRYERLAHFFIMLFLGFVLFLKYVKDTNSSIIFINSETVLYFILIPVSCVFAALFTIIINNIQDIKGDRISNKNRPLVLEQIPLKSYTRFAWLSLTISLLASILVNRSCFIFIILVIGIYYIYSCPPFRIKKIPILSKFMVVGVTSFLIALMGYTVFGGTVLTFPLEYTFFILIPLSLAGNFIDIKDYEGDKEMGVSTLPVIFGLPVSKIIISVFTLFSYMTIYFIINEYHLPFWIEIAPFYFSVFHIYYLNRKKYNEKPIFVIYICGLIALITIFIDQI